MTIDDVTDYLRHKVKIKVTRYELIIFMILEALGMLFLFLIGNRCLI